MLKKSSKQFETHCILYGGIHFLFLRFCCGSFSILIYISEKLLVCFSFVLFFVLLVFQVLGGIFSTTAKVKAEQSAQKNSVETINKIKANKNTKISIFFVLFF